MKEKYYNKNCDKCKRNKTWTYKCEINSYLNKEDTDKHRLNVERLCMDCLLQLEMFLMDQRRSIVHAPLPIIDLGPHFKLLDEHEEKQRNEHTHLFFTPPTLK